MVTKIYKTLWALIAMAAAIMYLTGNFGAITVVAFGMVLFGMIYMGIMGVLPVTISHPSEPKIKPAKVEAATDKSGYVQTKPASVH